MTTVPSARPARILVTGCGGPLGVNVTRSLRCAPESLFLLGTECNAYHAHLSLTDKTVLIPPARDSDAYLTALRRLVAAHQIDLVLPTHPVEVNAVSSHRAHLGNAQTFLPPHSAIVHAESKWLTYQLLRDKGVAVPQTTLIARAEDVAQVFDDLPSRPIWFRGAGTPGLGIGVASLPCREVAHAVAWVDHHRGWGHFIASEYLPGRNLTWCGLYLNGALIACQSRERLEYVLPHVSPSGITGAPAVTRTISEPWVRETSEAAVRALDGPAHGAYFVDLKGDSAGTPRVTEINAGRFGTTIHFYTKAGCNLPYLLTELALGRRPAGMAYGTPLVDPIAPHTYWIRTLDCGPVLLHNLPDDHDAIDR